MTAVTDMSHARPQAQPSLSHTIMLGLFANGEDVFSLARTPTHRSLSLTVVTASCSDDLFLSLSLLISIRADGVRRTLDLTSVESGMASLRWPRSGPGGTALQRPTMLGGTCATSTCSRKSFKRFIDILRLSTTLLFSNSVVAFSFQMTQSLFLSTSIDVVGLRSSVSCASRRCHVNAQLSHAALPSG